MATDLIYGWYGRGNAGDELMKLALENMLRPRGLALRFVDKIYGSLLHDVEAVIFGGGSILYGAPNVTPDALQVLASGSVPVFYVGVGIETEIHPVHQKLMSVARIIAARERDIPDLVFSLPVPENDSSVEKKGIIVIPNIEVVPVWEDAHWKHVAWEHFKDEFAQAIDVLLDKGVKVSYLLMCNNDQMKDAWATSELIARMKRRNKPRDIYAGVGTEIVPLMQSHHAVVTQRYHGIILAEAAGVPYVSIDHHDKLKNAQPSRGMHLSYYGMTKASLISSIESAINSTLKPHLVSRQVYDDLARKIVEIVGQKL